jgi:hypothetical protein
MYQVPVLESVLTVSIIRVRQVTLAWVPRWIDHA